ncbi:hypothetical protein SAMN04488542_1284 [Fontibacillus panacisegetis]|uniref:Uncharacterized protein n=1 Tax=Fontibacillus panacisegetis TaxID=670482 RepID=A0A1G7RZ17_9BACL|nr:hypothetical protein [Fontibacillus panacisegetis]SDG16006.1 hypothetical protein SAMN04488542_1284 [Fontibacillus panacisegetis]
MPEDSGSNATFYHYKLLKRIVLPQSFIRSYTILPLIWLAAEMIFLSWTSIFFFLLAIPVVLWIQYVISRSVLFIINHSYRKRWSFTRRLPWIGYLPDQFVGYSAFRRVHLHSAWIGCCIIAILIPWSPASFIISLFCSHLWFIAPRLYILGKLKNQPKNGMIKFNEQDISYYMP